MKFNLFACTLIFSALGLAGRIHDLARQGAQNNAQIFAILNASPSFDPFASDEAGETLGEIAQRTLNNDLMAFLQERPAPRKPAAKTSKRARDQLLSDLDLAEVVLESNFESPIVCIGTGRDQNALLLSHARMTLVRKNDLCIDILKRVKPDVVCDGWEVCRMNQDLLPPEHFAAVYFSHVGKLGIPLQSTHLVPTLEGYLRALLPGGAFVFNSEVYIQESALQALAERNEFKDFEDLKAEWLRRFMSCGFSEVKVIVKNEDSYLRGAVSVLLVAKKTCTASSK